MNKTNKLVIGLGTLALVLGVYGVFSGQAEAYAGDSAVKGPNYTLERHTAMEKAFDTSNYTEWKNLMSGKGRVTQVINKDNFAKFAEAHQLAEKGDTAGAKKIRQELGLGLKAGSGQGANGITGRGQNRANCLNK